MKSSSLNVPAFLTAVLFFLAACDNSTTKDSNTGSDSANQKENNNTSNSTASNTNTIVTTPQTMILVTHRVKDYTAWKASYDGHDSIRLANGLHSYVVGRNTEDPNNVFVAVKADDAAKAETFSKSPALKEAMQKGGVTGTPSMYVVNITYLDTAVLSNPLRSFTTFKVKDWATWEKNFKEGEQERIANGIVVRGYGHEVNDNTQIRLVTAVLDTAKAFAYYKSDALKKRREAGGVIGDVKRFLFNVAQRY